MGMDLEVLATQFRERGGELLPTARLRFDRDERLFVQLHRQATPALVHPLPEGLKVGIYEDQGLAFRDTDRHGNPLTFTTSADMCRLRLPGEEFAPWNRAIVGFLLALPHEVKIIL